MANENPTLTATRYTDLSQITWESFTGNLFDNSNNYRVHPNYAVSKKTR